MSSTTLTIDQICISPHNVRIDKKSQQATAAMEKSILSVGLLLPLIVHPIEGDPNMWGAHVGGRRYRSIKALIERGDLPRDWPVKVLIREGLSVGQLLEESASENIQRKDLLPYEVFAFVSRAVAEGEPLDQIALSTGQDVKKVRQWLRLGNLARPIFDALADGRISVDQASAFAATEDQALQISTFESFAHLPDFERTPAKIRAMMKVGDSEANRLLRFVGADVYREAGGRFELDLFAEGEDERGIVLDEELLRRLVNDALDGFRKSLRERSGRDELRFVPKPPENGYGGADGTLRVMPNGEADEVGTEGGRFTLPEGDVVSFIRISEGGFPHASFWWASTKAKYGKGKTPTETRVSTVARGAPVATRQAVDAALKDETGLGQDAIQAFRSVRRVIMRASLLDDAMGNGTVATDYLVWSQLRAKIGGDLSEQLGIGALQLPDNGPESARDHVAATEASRIWAQALYEVRRQTFFTGKDLAEAFLDYRASSRELKNLAVALVTGWALTRSINAEGYELPMHDAIAAELELTSDVEIRKYWRPSTAMLDLLPKGQRLAIAEPFVEAATFGPWSRLKSSEITANVLEVVLGTAAGIRASMAAAAASWVHPLLRFTPIGADDVPAGDAKVPAVAE